MDKAYSPQQSEDNISAQWEQSAAFQPNDAEETFTIVIPPPNVTGTLHVGHSMFLTVQDIMIRWNRMKGTSTLWVPGTDHAAIATETVVLKNLGITERNAEISREDFMKEAHSWTEKTHTGITQQIKKMGASCDWTREAYTLDEKRSHAVNTMFQMLFTKGLIYRGNRLINWSVGAQSVLSDDEVEWEEKKEPFYYIRCGEFIIGTVRPETKCADSPVVVSETGKYVRVRYSSSDQKHTEYFILSEYLFQNTSERKKVFNLLDEEGSFEVVDTYIGADLVGQEFEYPTYAGNRRFVVLADEQVIDIEKGAGSMTISCSHSADDYDLAKRRNLNDYWIEKINREGTMTAVAGECGGMSVLKAREKSASLMRAQGLLVGEDTTYSHRVPMCYRSHTVVEPMVSKQWFIAVEKEFLDDYSGETTTLKKQMQAAIRENHVELVPQRFEKTYFHWIDNLKDWCISRQIWWGHRIPVWYRQDTDTEETHIGATSPTEGIWTQDEDTLDTWFSSALWPFSVLNWPNTDSADYTKFYPTQVLETGHDILFFWVARMIMFGKFATGQYPFKTVYLHGLVQDAEGKKMSKSKENGIDPLEIIKEFGADALRLSLIMGTTPGNSINIGKEKIAGCRNFCNKLWNVSRFVLGQDIGTLPETPQTDLQKWILSEMTHTEHMVTNALEKYRFGEAAEHIWQFTWNEFADWALESAKAEQNPQTNAVLKDVLRRLLLLSHPFIPFVTEKIWAELGQKTLLIEESWRKTTNPSDIPDTEFNIIQEVTKKIRSMRKNAGVDPTKKITAFLSGKNTEILERNTAIIISLARLNVLELNTTPDETGATDAVSGITIFLPSSGMIDEEVEKKRIAKELQKAENMLQSLNGRLSNTDFVQKAPAELVQKMRDQKAEWEEKKRILSQE